MATTQDREVSGDPRDLTPSDGVGAALARGDRLQDENKREARRKGKFTGLTSIEKEVLVEGLMAFKALIKASTDSRAEERAARRFADVLENAALALFKD